MFDCYIISLTKQYKEKIHRNSLAQGIQVNVLSNQQLHTKLGTLCKTSKKTKCDDF